jgi:hypothetical protein
MSVTKETVDATTLMNASRYLLCASENLRIASILARPDLRAELIVGAEQYIDRARKLIPEEAF